MHSTMIQLLGFGLCIWGLYCVVEGRVWSKFRGIGGWYYRDREPMEYWFHVIVMLAFGGWLLWVGFGG